MRKKIFSSFILLFFSVLAFAQEVTVYTDCNYSGSRYVLTVGRFNVYQMKIQNDRLSSIQMPYGMKVTIYENDNFQGQSKTYFASTPCLEAGWRNSASSIVVEYDANQPVYNQNDYVTFYLDCYQRGTSQILRPGTYSGTQLGNLKYNISSFTLSNTNLRVKLFANNETVSGYSTTYESSVYCLPNSMNDKTGSLVIEYKTTQYPTNDPNNNNGNNNGNNTGYSSYATFYSECDFNGNALRLMPGRYTDTKLGVLKNAIASAQVPSNLRVTAYTNSDNMFGQNSTITQDISCMDYTMKNKIASVVIEEISGMGNNNNNNNNYPTQDVIIYVDENYRGQSAILRPGTYRTMAEAGNFPDNAISSLTVPDGYRVVLYENENFSGKTLTVTSSRGNFFLTSWNDKASSIAVYKDR